MNELLQLASSVDWASVLIGAGTVATALGFGLGTPLVIAGKTLKEMRTLVDKTPINNRRIMNVAKREGLTKAQQQMKKLPPHNNIDDLGGDF